VWCGFTLCGMRSCPGGSVTCKQHGRVVVKAVAALVPHDTPATLRAHIRMYACRCLVYNNGTLSY
jgi:hypothetical protein